MIRIKDISWVPVDSTISYINDGSDRRNYSAIVRNVSFLLVIHYSSNPLQYYIHPTLPIFKLHGNQGIDKWGLFTSLEECKSKAEELITEEILSFIDMRDHKISELLDE